jgi:hypothetical protein
MEQGNKLIMITNIKNQINKIRVKPKIKVKPDLDNLEYLMNDAVKDFKHPKQSKKCEHDDQMRLNKLFTPRLIRISVLCSNFMGIDWKDYLSVCGLCRQNIYEYYFKIFSDHPERKVPLSVWELQLKENYYRNIVDNARSLYEKYLKDYRYKLTDVSKSEIESQKKYYDNATSIWTASLKELNEKLEELDIESKGGKVE